MTHLQLYMQAGLDSGCVFKQRTLRLMTLVTVAIAPGIWQPQPGWLGKIKHHGNKWNTIFSFFPPSRSWIGLAIFPSGGTQAQGFTRAVSHLHAVPTQRAAADNEFWRRGGGRAFVCPALQYRIYVTMEPSEKDNKACAAFPLASEILYWLYEAYVKSHYTHFFKCSVKHLYYSLLSMLYCSLLLDNV